MHVAGPVICPNHSKLETGLKNWYRLVYYFTLHNWYTRQILFKLWQNNFSGPETYDHSKPVSKFSIVPTIISIPTGSPPKAINRNGGAWGYVVGPDPCPNRSQNVVYNLVYYFTKLEYQLGLGPFQKPKIKMVDTCRWWSGTMSELLRTGLKIVYKISILLHKIIIPTGTLKKFRRLFGGPAICPNPSEPVSKCWIQLVHYFSILASGTLPNAINKNDGDV